MSKKTYTPKHFNEMAGIAVGAALRYMSGFSLEQEPYALEESASEVMVLSRRSLSPESTMKSIAWLVKQAGGNVREGILNGYTSNQKIYKHLFSEKEPDILDCAFDLEQRISKDLGKCQFMTGFSADILNGDPTPESALGCIEAYNNKLRDMLKGAAAKASDFSDEMLRIKMEGLKKLYESASESDDPTASASRVKIQKQAKYCLMLHLSGKFWYSEKWKFYYSILDLREKNLVEPRKICSEILHEDIYEVMDILEGLDYEKGPGTLRFRKKNMPRSYQMSWALLLNRPAIVVNPLEMGLHIKHLKANIKALIEQFCADYLESKGISTLSTNPALIPDVTRVSLKVIEPWIQKLEDLAHPSKSLATVKAEFDVIQKQIKCTLKKAILLCFSSKDQRFSGPCRKDGKTLIQYRVSKLISVFIRWGTLPNPVLKPGNEEKLAAY